MIRLMLATLLIGGCTASNPKTEIAAVLTQQTAAWNKGDLRGYMNGYWMSDSLQFTGGTQHAFGWQPTLERYQKSYPTKEAMGILEFSELNIQITSSETAFSTGRWQLTKSNGTVYGRFTLVWQKIGSSWVIVADHSC